MDISDINFKPFDIDTSVREIEHRIAEANANIFPYTYYPSDREHQTVDKIARLRKLFLMYFLEEAGQELPDKDYKGTFSNAGFGISEDFFIDEFFENVTCPDIEGLSKGIVQFIIDWSTRYRGFGYTPTQEEIIGEYKDKSEHRVYGYLLRRVPTEDIIYMSYSSENSIEYIDNENETLSKKKLQIMFVLELSYISLAIDQWMNTKNITLNENQKDALASLCYRFGCQKVLCDNYPIIQFILNNAPGFYVKMAWLDLKDDMILPDDKDIRSTESDIYVGNLPMDYVSNNISNGMDNDPSADDGNYKKSYIEIQLSDNFSLSDLTRSTKADIFKIDNRPPDQAIDNLRQLANELLEPIKKAYGKPIRVNSGYRCPQLNRLVGGSNNSSHMYGYAADIADVSGNNRQLWSTVMSICNNLNFDQIISEKGPSMENPRWVHVSIGPKNRKQIMRIR